jgi:hypothetical protein
MSMRTNFARRWTVIFGISIGACLGCDDTEQVCTLIGCADPLAVHLSATPVGPFQVTLLVDGVVQAEVTCPGVTNCRDVVFFQIAPTDRVSVRVTTATGTRVTDFAKITYTHRRVNGPDCPPDCLNAAITVQVPA